MEDHHVRTLSEQLHEGSTNVLQKDINSRSRASIPLRVIRLSRVTARLQVRKDSASSKVTHPKANSSNTIKACLPSNIIKVMLPSSNIKATRLNNSKDILRNSSSKVTRLNRIKDSRPSNNHLTAHHPIARTRNKLPRARMAHLHRVRNLHMAHHREGHMVLQLLYNISTRPTVHLMAGLPLHMVLHPRSHTALQLRYRPHQRLAMAQIKMCNMTLREKRTSYGAR